MGVKTRSQVNVFKFLIMYQFRFGISPATWGRVQFTSNLPMNSITPGNVESGAMGWIEIRSLEICSQSLI